MWLTRAPVPRGESCPIPACSARLRRRGGSLVRPSHTAHMHPAPRADLGFAGHLLTNWETPKRYATNWELDIGNSATEWPMRPVALGRKNWLLASNVNGGRTPATLHSQVPSAKR